MVRTPTYWVFDLFRPHQDAQLLPLTFHSPMYQLDGKDIPALNASASRDSLGRVHLSVVNIDARKAYTIEIHLPDLQLRHVSGRILSSDALTDCNTFSDPNRIHPVAFHGAQFLQNRVTLDIPAHSIVMLELRP